MGVHPDGDRILLLERLGRRTTTELRMIINFRQVLEERLER